MMDWTWPYNHWFRWTCLAIVSCSIFFLVLNRCNFLNLVHQNIVFLEWGKVVFIGTVIWPVSLIIKFFILNDNRFFVSPSHRWRRTFRNVNLRSKVEMDGNEGKILLLVCLVIKIFFDLLNGGKVINRVMMGRIFFFHLRFLVLWTLALGLKYFLGSVIVQRLWNFYISEVVDTFRPLIVGKLAFWLIGNILIKDRVGKNRLIFMDIALILIKFIIIFQCFLGLLLLFKTVRHNYLISVSFYFLLIIIICFPLIRIRFRIRQLWFDWVNSEDFLLSLGTVNIDLGNLIKLLLRRIQIGVYHEFLLKFRQWLIR